MAGSRLDRSEHVPWSLKEAEVGLETLLGLITNQTPVSMLG